jgi:hypothetical protein
MRKKSTVYKNRAKRYAKKSISKMKMFQAKLGGHKKLLIAGALTTIGTVAAVAIVRKRG